MPTVQTLEPLRSSTPATPSSKTASKHTPKKSAKLVLTIPAGNMSRSSTPSPSQTTISPTTLNITHKGSPRLMTSLSPRPTLTRSNSSSPWSPIPTTPTGPSPWERVLEASPTPPSRSNSSINESYRYGQESGRARQQLAKWKDRSMLMVPNVGGSRASTWNRALTFPSLGKPKPYRGPIPKLIITSPDGFVEKVNPSNSWLLNPPRLAKGGTDLLAEGAADWKTYTNENDVADVNLLFRGEHYYRPRPARLAVPAQPLRPITMTVEVGSDFDIFVASKNLNRSHDWKLLVASKLVTLELKRIE